MKIGIAIPAMISGIGRQELFEWIRRVEDDGWDTIGLGERISYDNLEMFSVLSAAAALTERVGIAATISVLPMHSEVHVAKVAATIDVISGGRFTLGVGVGGRNEDYRSLGSSFSNRFARLDRQVERIRETWDGVPPEEGLDAVGPTPAHRIPILSGALGPKSLARAATWADGVAGFELDPSPAALATSRDNMLGAFETAGSPRPYLMTSFWFALGDNAQTQLRDYARGYLGVFGDEMSEAMASMTTAYGPDAVAAAVAAAEEAGFDELQLVATTSDIDELTRLTAALR